MFLKIKYILQGYFYWFISLFKKLKNHKLYEYRMSICRECENNKDDICEIYTFASSRFFPAITKVRGKS